jgi:23S rRNA (guanosine2251-2'-O)-methyltransferase
MREHRQKKQGAMRPLRRDEDAPQLIWGIHAVAAALANPARQIKRLWLTDNGEHRLGEAMARRGLIAERVLPRDLDKRLGADTVHQGVLIEVEALPEPSLADIAEQAHAGAGPVLVLDQITDPHNVGAILRSAAAFGAAGLVMTRRHSPPLAGALAKAASGALEQVPICLEQNLARALTELSEQGVRCLGLDGSGETLIEEEPLAGPVAFVLGAEGRGLRQLTREKCEKLCRILTVGSLASLNVSNAAAVSLHMAALARQESGRSPIQGISDWRPK